MKPVGVLRFLGTNCDSDVLQAFSFLKKPAQYIWWADRFQISDYSSFVLPGGFSYGDYLRCGSLAAQAPAMEDVVSAAKQGYPVLGICNGFQILCEAKLLEGALTKNLSRLFQEEWVNVENQEGQKFRLPIAHSMGRYVATSDMLNKLHDNKMIWLKYLKNPNGAMDDIAGISNKKGNVRALMPHPERAMCDWMGSTDGQKILEAL